MTNIGGSKKNLVIAVNTVRFFINHRIHLAEGAKTEGYQVHVVSPPEPGWEKIESLGFHFHSVPMERKSLIPLYELVTIFRLWKTFKTIRPDVVHLFTIKPVIYGTLACRILGVKKVIVTLTGLGYVFSRGKVITRFLKYLAGLAYRTLLQHKSVTVVFQNPDDRDLFTSTGWVNKDSSIIILGTGVDTERFHPVEEPPPPVRVTFPARFLRDKGIFELIDAADLLYKKKVLFELWLCGELDPGNPNSLNEKELEVIEHRPFIKNLGFCRDMAEIFRKSHIVCLPSYREGIPLSLIEAAACGLPIITTDTPGCREVITESVNGFLVPVGDRQLLAERLGLLIEDGNLRRQLGVKSRQKAMSQFDRRIVVRQNLDLYRPGDNQD